MAKSVKVHDDTHRALKLLKAKRRNRSIDQLIREMISSSTGTSVDGTQPNESEALTRYLKD